MSQSVIANDVTLGCGPDHYVGEPLAGELSSYDEKRRFRISLVQNVENTGREFRVRPIVKGEVNRSNRGLDAITHVQILTLSFNRT